tara:strand:+ start:1787 stop:1918 length:132 start_codon:yes stop_codon:yes gene_type:complete
MPSRFIVSSAVSSLRALVSFCPSVFRFASAALNASDSSPGLES